MRRVLPPVLSFIAGIVVGYLIHAAIAPTPPALESGRDDRTVGRRTEDLAGIAALPDEAEPPLQGTGDGVGETGEAIEEAAAGSSTPAAFDVAADGTENPVRIAGESGDPMLGALRVFVTGKDGAPRSGVEVTASGYRMTGRGMGVSVNHNGTTNARGWAFIPNLPPMRYRVHAKWPAARDPDGHGWRSAYAHVLPGRVTEVALVGPRGGTLVTGRVIDSTGKKTYPGVKVSLMRKETFFTDGLITTADDNGRFRLEEVPPGRYDLTAHGRGMPYTPGPPMVISVPATGSIVIDLITDRDRRVLALSGIVRDAVTGRPIPGVKITSISGAYDRAVTDREGRYRLYHLGPGRHRLTASKDGYAYKWLEDVVLARIGETRDIELSPAAVILFRVSDREGQPVAGRLGVSFFPRTAEGHKLGASVTLDENGRGIHRQAPTGSYKLVLQMRDVGEAVVSCALVAGEQTVEVRLE